MDMNEYQTLALRTKLRPMPWYYAILKLTGEAGEVSEKYGKLVRDKAGQIDDAFVQDIKKELGDVLWYVASAAEDLGLTLDEIAQANVDKLASRQARNVIQGSGDDR